MGRPFLGKTRFVVSLPADKLEQLDAVAADRDKTRAEAVEEAVDAYVRRSPAKPNGKRRAK